jgi:glycosyltransferase involved in cell wall biosynthesis
MNTKLSILICSLADRKDLLNRLLDILTGNHRGDIIHHPLGNVEILVDTDGGEKSTGQKRNDLLEKARGDYVCFVDDDDLVPDYYVERILETIETSPDVVGINGIITFSGKNPRKFIHSIQYKSWFEKDGIYYRCPHHLNPVKRELALQTKFHTRRTYNEDFDYSLRLLPLLKTEVYIEDVMYYYLYDPAISVRVEE